MQMDDSPVYDTGQSRIIAVLGAADSGELACLQGMIACHGSCGLVYGAER